MIPYCVDEEWPQTYCMKHNYNLTLYTDATTIIYGFMFYRPCLTGLDQILNPPLHQGWIASQQTIDC